MFHYFSNLFTGRQALQPNVPHISAVASHHDSHDPLLQANQSQWYEGSPYVYVAVNRIAEAAALVPIKVYQRVGQQQVLLDTHPLLDLLNNPNPNTSRFELLEQTVGMLELTGNAYWFIAGDQRGRPREIWTLRPDRVTVVPDSQRYVRGYLYELDGKRIPLEAVEVIHFKRWHPNNDYYGLSALTAARLAVTSDRAMATWNANTFGRDYGIPAGILNIKDNITEKDFERIRQEWRSTYGSSQRRTAFMRGGTMEWLNVGLSHTDLDFLQGRRANRDEILNIFGIPVGMVSDNATEANAKVAERVFIERTLYPKLVRIAQRLTQELLPFYGDGLTAEFEDIRPTDMHMRLEEIKTAQSVLSINEIRAQFYQLPTVPWGDLPLALAQAPQATPVSSAIVAPLNGTHSAEPIAQPSESEPPMKAYHLHDSLNALPRTPSTVPNAPTEWDTDIDIVLEDEPLTHDEP